MMAIMILVNNDHHNTPKPLQRKISLGLLYNLIQDYAKPRNVELETNFLVNLF